MVVQAVLAALAGALAFAVAAALQQLEAARATTRGMANPRLLWQLAHRPMWLAGIGATGFGAGLHLFALSKGSLTLVQPLGVSGLVFAVPLAAALRGHRVRPGEVIATLLVVGGLGALLGALPGGSGTSVVDPGFVTGLVVIACGTAAVTTAVAAHVTGRARSMLLATGAGLCFGGTSALARVLLATHDTPDATGTIVLAGAGIMLLAPVGFLLGQSAYRAGDLASALATVTVVDPLVAVAGGVLLLHEPLPTALEPVLVVALGAVLVFTGIALLARSPAQAPV